MPEVRAPQTHRVRESLALLALLAVAATMRALAWSHTAVMFNDGPIFLGMARAIDAGDWAEVLSHPFHPLYPALIALIARTSVDFETAAVAVSIFGGLLMVVAIYLFVRAHFDRGLAWLAAWTVALHPWAVDFSSDVMSDGLYAGLYLLGFAAMAALLERPRLGTALGCGVAAALAYWVRPEGVGLLVTCLLLLTIKSVVEPRYRSKLLVATAGLVLAASLVMAPLVVSLTQRAGEFSLTQKKSIAGLVDGRAEVASRGPRQVAGSGEGARDSTARRTSIPLPRSSEQADGGGARRPDRSVFGFLEAVSRAGRTSLAALRYEIAAFAVIGFWGLRRRWRFSREATIGLSALLYSGVLVLLVWGAGYVARRHALAALLPICGYAAIGWRTLYFGALDRFTRQAAPRANAFKTSAWACALLVVVLALVWGARDLRDRRIERVPLRLAAEWLKQNAKGQAPVAAQKLRVAYYAGASYVPLPSGNDGPIEESLRGQGVAWVVIGEADLGDHRGLAAGLGDWLVPVHTVGLPGDRALVLEMRPRPAI